MKDIEAVFLIKPRFIHNKLSVSNNEEGGEAYITLK